MQQPKLSRSVLVATVVCGATLPSLAYGLTVGEVVEYVATSPGASLAVDCAAGAIAGGLVAWASCRGVRTQLEESLQEALNEATRANAAVQRLSMQMDELLRARGGMASLAAESVKREYANAEPPAIRAIRSELEVGLAILAEPAAAPEPQAVAEPAAASKPPEVRQIRKEPPAEEVSQAEGQSPAQNEERSREATGRFAARSLRRRLGRPDLNDLPVIERGDTNPLSVRMAAKASQPRNADPAQEPDARLPIDRAARVALIDRRVPRFDDEDTRESSPMVPTADVVSVATAAADEDVFEAAMRAMDETMTDTGSLSREYLESQPPESLDASAYVDYLVQDELERNRREAGKRYSRAHLTMFEGTGDLSAVRKAPRGRARHFKRLSKEA